MYGGGEDLQLILGEGDQQYGGGGGELQMCGSGEDLQLIVKEGEKYGE